MTIRQYFETTKGGVMCVEIIESGDVTICAAKTRAAARHTVRSWRRFVGRRARRGRVGEPTGYAGIKDLRRAIEIAEEISRRSGRGISVSGCTPRLQRIWSRALRDRSGWSDFAGSLVYTHVKGEGTAMPAICAGVI